MSEIVQSGVTELPFVEHIISLIQFPELKIISDDCEQELLVFNPLLPKPPQNALSQWFLNRLSNQA